MRSLALACAVKGGREIAIIGHTDCQVAWTTTMQLLEKFKALGVDRSRLPENLNEFFGMFATERQNVIKACDFVRQSPLIGPKIPVHGLLADIESGKLEWIVNGYNTLPGQQQQSATGNFPQLSAMNSLKNFEMGEMKFPETKIGEWASAKFGEIGAAAQQAVEKIQPVVEEKTKQQWQEASQTAPPETSLPPPILAVEPVKNNSFKSRSGLLESKESRLKIFLADIQV